MKTDLILQRSTFSSTNSSSTIFNRLSTGSIFLVRKTIFLVCIGFLGFNSWGQIAQRGSAISNSAATANMSSIEINKPTGIVSGEIMIVSILQNETDNDNGGLSSANLTGWTLIDGRTIRSEGTGNGDNAWFGTVLYRVADGTEGTSFIFALPNSRADMALISIVAFSGVTATNGVKADGTAGGPFDVDPGTLNVTNASTSTASSITTASSNSAIILLSLVSNDRTFSDWTATSPSTFTEIYENLTTSADDGSIGAAWNTKAAAGTTGDGVVALSSSDRSGAILLALRAAPFTSQVYSASGTFSVPCYVSSVRVEAWGAGGAGGGVTRDVRAGGGGEGGSYVSGSLPVTAGATCNITIGTGGAGGTGNGGNGGFSRFEIGTTTHFNAIGGAGGARGNNFGTGGNSSNSGNIVSGSSQVTFYGGNGGTAANSNSATSGGGGGSAGQGGNGGDGGELTPGTAGLNGGVAGATGRGSQNDGNGINGGIPGAGGSGARNANDGTDYIGGNGGNGLVVLSWACPSATIAYSASSFCKSVTSAAVTLTGTDARSTCSNTFSSTTGLSLNTTTGAINASLSTPGTYTITYSLPAAGGCSAVSETASITITQPTTEITIDNATIGDGDYLWNGNINSNGNVKDNWFVLNSGVYSIPSQVPQSTDEVFVVNATTAVSCVSSNLTVPVAGSFRAQNIHVGPDANVTFADNASIEVSGNFVNNGNMSAGSGAVNFTGGAATQTISGTGALNFSNVIINKSSGVVRLGNNISISGALDFQQGNLDLNGKTLNYSGGNISTNSGIIGSTTSSKLNFTASSQIPSNLFQSEIYDLEISGVNTNVTSDAEFTITNELIVGSQSTLTLSNGWAVTMLGNITNNGTINGLGTSSVLIFNKEGSQTVTGAALSVGSITINKLSGNLILNAPLQVKGTLTMTKGNIITTSTNLLTVGSSSSAPGSINYSGGTITGPLRRYFANSTGTDYYFPIGNTASTRGVTINMSQSPGSNDEYITAQYKAGTPQVSVSGATLYDGLPLTTADGQLIQNFDEEGYWQIDPKQYNSGIDMANYTISLQMNNISGVNDYTKTRIIKADGPSHVAWSALTHVSATGSNENFTLTATGNGFSWFNGGGDNNNNPLPVELISFNGTCKEGMVNLLWQTASEFNSSHFDVEKSTDGETWRVLATIPSAGTSNELLTYQTVDNNGTSGSNYYRLRQVDIDGKEKLYDPINVSCVETTAGYFTSYPNPSGNEFQVVVNNKEILGACTLNIVDVNGKVIDQRTIEMKDGINMFVINQELNPGIYFLNISNGSKTTQVIKHAVK